MTSEQQRERTGRTQIFDECPRCHGTGAIELRQCEKCGGAGVLDPEADDAE